MFARAYQLVREKRINLNSQSNKHARHRLWVPRRFVDAKCIRLNQHPSSINRIIAKSFRPGDVLIHSAFTRLYKICIFF